MACLLLVPSVFALTAVGCSGADPLDESVAQTSQALNSVEFCNQSGLNVIMGTSNNDNITGTNVADCIVGLGGQDLVNGMLGDSPELAGGDNNDFLSGGNGQDRLIGNLGDDFMLGDEGDDDFLTDCFNHNRFDAGAGTDQCQFNPADSSALSCERTEPANCG